MVGAVAVAQLADLAHAGAKHIGLFAGLLRRLLGGQALGFALLGIGLEVVAQAGQVVQAKALGRSVGFADALRHEKSPDTRRDYIDWGRAAAEAAGRLREGGEPAAAAGSERRDYFRASI
ncbi:hypothetical protein D3C72_1698290 [compost metagenome]